MPTKYGDPGMFYILYTFEMTRIEKTMLDLGASINFTPLTMYQNLNMWPLKPTWVVIQLVDMFNVYPEDILKDVLVKVEDRIFPADFYVLDKGRTYPKSLVMMLGRYFLNKTSRTRIGCLLEKRLPLTYSRQNDILKIQRWWTMWTWWIKLWKRLCPN